jgi:hypothetical protein
MITAVPEIVAPDAGDVIETVGGVGFPEPLELALLTNPAQPFSPTVANPSTASTRRLWNLVLVFVVERIVVNIIRLSPDVDRLPQVAGAHAFPTLCQATYGARAM